MVKGHARQPRSVAVLSAPSNLGLKPPALGLEPGVRHAPSALLKHDLLHSLRAVYAGEVTPPPYDPAVDTSLGIRNVEGIRTYTTHVADRVGELLDEPQFPLVLGGDCSILLGSALALRRRGRFGVLFLDGHTDLLTPSTSETGGAAGMDLALATGSGPDELTTMEGLRPYFQPEDVVVYGFRWPEPGSSSPAQPPPPMLSFPLATVRERGVASTAQQALSFLAKHQFWIHVDADVLDPKWMPAVDSPDPGGMSPEELATVLRIALAAENCIGMELTIYDPTREPTQACASLLVDLLAGAMMPSAHES